MFGAANAGGNTINHASSLGISAAYNRVLEATNLSADSVGNRGTFTCNGTTPVTVTNARVRKNSLVLFSLNTVGGTVGAVPNVVALISGTGFNAACTAADTSVYNYSIN